MRKPPTTAAEVLARWEMVSPGRTAIRALEYACTIESDSRRGVWVRAFVEEETWALDDFVAWLTKQHAPEG